MPWRPEVCYAYVMAIRRITISVPEEVAGRIRKAARATPVSAWVTGLIEHHLDETELDRQWEAFYQEVGPSAKETRRADGIFTRLTRRTGRRGVA